MNKLVAMVRRGTQGEERHQISLLEIYIEGQRQRAGPEGGGGGLTDWILIFAAMAILYIDFK